MKKGRWANNKNLVIEKDNNKISSKDIIDFNINLRGDFSRHSKNGALKNIKIVAYTSISPNHVNLHNQKDSIESWNKLGIKVYSLNTPDEINILKTIYPKYVRFVTTHKTTKHIFGKTCVNINEMINHFNANKTGDILMLINSDIILSATNKFLEKIKSASHSCILISSRNDYSVEFSDGKKYIYGFDVFFINKKYSEIFPCSMYSMGQTWWDYWIPYMAIKNNIKVLLIKNDFSFHKNHPIQYNIKDWQKMTEYFKWENGIEGEVQQINDLVRNNIINNSISIKL